MLLVAFVATVAVRKYSDSVERSVPAILNDPKIISLSEQATQQQLAVQRAPRDTAMRWKLADTYQKLGAIDHAQEQLKAIMKLEPKAVEAPLALANTYLAYKQWSTAEKVYREAALKAPRNSKAWAGLAITLYHQKRYLEAIEPARKSVHFQPDDPNNYFVTAHCYLEYGLQHQDPSYHATELRNAIKHYNRVLMVLPDHSHIY